MNNTKGMKRRKFLKVSATSLAGAGLISVNSLQGKTPAEENKLPKIRRYNLLGRTGFKASDISVGKPFNPALLKALLDSGINFIDTAESYGRGLSEKTVGEAIKGRDRKALFINSKLSMRGNPAKEQILKRAYKCLERLQTGYLDCMMIHSCGTVETLKYAPFHQAMDQLKKEGKLRFVGVSNHGSNYSEVSETMEEVLSAAAEDGRYDLILMVYNFMKKEMGENILSACKQKNIGTMLMKINPVGSYLAYKGNLDKAKKEGKPTKRLEEFVARFKQRADKAQDFIARHKLAGNDEITQAAYRFALNNPEVDTALFNFSTFDQINTLLGVSGSSLSKKEKQTLALLARGYDKLYCRHACGICESSCPAKVPVNTIMRYNYYFAAKKEEKYAMQKYAELNGADAGDCYNCAGNCQRACPYGVAIQELLTTAHLNLTV